MLISGRLDNTAGIPTGNVVEFSIFTKILSVVARTLPGNDTVAYYQIETPDFKIGLGKAEILSLVESFKRAGVI